MGRTFEHWTVEFRGYSLGPMDQQQLASMGKEGWAIAAAFATTEGAASKFTFVMSREIAPELAFGTLEPMVMEPLKVEIDYDRLGEAIAAAMHGKPAKGKR